MAEETIQKDGVDDTSVNKAAGLIEGLLGEDFDIGVEDPDKKKKPESKEDAPEEEEEDVEPEEEAEETAESEEEGEEEPAEETEDEEEEEPEPELYTVKVNGKEFQVTQDDLMKGYQRNADYTQKLQVLSEQRKESETELASARQERQQYAEALQQMDQNADADLKKYQEMDWDALKEEDPEQYRIEKADFRELQDAKKEIAQEQKALSETARKDYQVQRKKVAKLESEKFLGFYPSWKKDKAKAKTGMDRIVKYGVTQGYSEGQINTILDHRHLVVLDKARKYDLIQKADPSKKKLKGVGKFIKPGTGKAIPAKGSKAIKASKAKMQKLAQTGSVKDAASAIEDLI